MIIIADTSPLSALAEIGCLELLPALYGSIVVPETVRQECLHPNAPTDLAPWFLNAGWLQVVPDPPFLLPEVRHLDPGEAAAITLASQCGEGAMLIIDDLDGRKLCDALQIRRTGTAGVLYQAALAGKLDFLEAVQRLQNTSFRISNTVLDTLHQNLLRESQRQVD